MQSVSITTEVVSSNPVHGEVYSIQHYVIKFATGRWFSPVSSTNKTDLHDIIKILLKVVLNTINLTPLLLTCFIRWIGCNYDYMMYRWISILWVQLSTFGKLLKKIINFYYITFTWHSYLCIKDTMNEVFLTSRYIYMHQLIWSLTFFIGFGIQLSTFFQLYYVYRVSHFFGG